MKKSLLLGAVVLALVSFVGCGGGATTPENDKVDNNVVTTVDEDATEETTAEGETVDEDATEETTAEGETVDEDATEETTAEGETVVEDATEETTAA